MLYDLLKNKHLILASASPRRQHFFRELNLDFEIRLKPVNEDYPEDLVKEQITGYLAVKKAAPFIDELQDRDVLITSDTIVWLDRKAIGKPESEADARNMLKRLSGRTHLVITSVAISSKHKQHVFHDTTKVHFGKLNDEEIDFYIKTYKPFDKAGSYGIQEWIGYTGIDRIEGSYFNVMGFPTRKFYLALTEFLK